MSEKSDSNADAERVDLKSLDVAEERRHELLRLFPETRTEGGKVDFDRLRLSLGETVDVGKERYGLTWPGKAECFRTIQTPSTATLRPMRDESVQFDLTENLIIEGDNLEVLKLLQKAYLGKVKMIYIDPPYNTGNDFIYPDNFAESLQTYLEYTRQVDAEGKKFSTNTEADGRFHSKWLNMMYPRLYLARNLLREDGVIFISIDDHEIADLRHVMDQVFGSENAVGEFVWHAKKGGGSDNNAVVIDHEYVVCYARDVLSHPLGEVAIKAEPLNKSDAKGRYRRGRELNKWGANSLRKDRPTMYFPVPGPDRQDVYPIRNDGKEGCWRWGKPKMLAAVREGEVEFEARGDGTFTVYEKVRTEEPRRKPFRTWQDSVGQTADGTKALKELFGGEKIYDFAKPTALISRLISMGASDVNDDGSSPVILDFFAGSGTTADAVLNANVADDVGRRFILVQLPQPTGHDSEAAKVGYPTIAEITKERVRRVIQHLGHKKGTSLELQESSQDLGFRLLSLAESNLLPWAGTSSDQKGELENQLSFQVNHLRPGRSDDDLLFEILLKEGFPLTTRFETVQVATQAARSLADGGLIVCLSRKLNLEAIRAIAEREPNRVVCLDEGFAGNDQLKANAVQIFKAKNIVFRTV